jgi:hypothetical protein
MKLATPMGALSGNNLQVSLPAVVSMTAVGRLFGRCSGCGLRPRHKTGEEQNGNDEKGFAHWLLLDLIKADSSHAEAWSE